MHTVRGRRAVAATLAVGACLAAAGCSTPGRSADGGAASPAAAASLSPGASSGSSSPSPGPSSSTSPVAPPLRPEAARGAAGQRRFARYVIALWGYALRTNDPAPLFAASFTKQPCQGCERLASTLQQRKREHWYVDFPGVVVRGIALRRSGDLTVAQASVSIPPSVALNTDGSFRSANPAHPHARFLVRMRMVNDTYRLVGFTLS